MAACTLGVIRKQFRITHDGMITKPSRCQVTSSFPFFKGACVPVISQLTTYLGSLKQLSFPYWAPLFPIRRFAGF